MKSILYSVMAAGILVACQSGSTEHQEEVKTEDTTAVTEATVESEPEAPKPIKSPRRQSAGDIDGVPVSIDYGSPYVKERVIWGELVPYGKLWRAGANQTTAITFGEAVMIADETISAGTYSLFFIPTEAGQWTVVLNSLWSEEEHDMWGTYGYDESKDVLRFEVDVDASKSFMESLTFTISNTGLDFSWENKHLAFDIKKA